MSNKKKNFYFSVIIPVYNVEEYLEETIKSIVNQSLSFTKYIQIILINDGSNDESGKICEKYSEMYPDNIIYISKENGGVSSARNAGLDIASGKIINFCDSDDYFSHDAFEKVKDFYEKNNSIDVVAIRLKCFEGAEGSWVNDVYFDENRIIDMEKEKYFMQCQVGASFIRKEKALMNRFDTRIKIHEDSVYLYKIFRDSPFCGVVGDATYWHRIRKKKSSATQNINIKENIFSMSELVISGLIDFYKQKYKKIPAYFQSFIIKEFDWYVTKNINEVELNKNEKIELKKTIGNIMSNLDYEEIKNHPYITEIERNRYLDLKKNIKFLFSPKKENKDELKHIKKLKKLAIRIRDKIKRKVKSIRYPFSRSIKKILMLEEQNNIQKSRIDDIEEKSQKMQLDIIEIKKIIDDSKILKNKIENIEKDNKLLRDSVYINKIRIEELVDKNETMNLEIESLKEECGYDFKNNVEYLYYFYGGSDNKGCEALLKTIVQNTETSREKNALVTFRKKDDLQAGLEKNIKYIFEPSLKDRSKKIEYMGNCKFNFDDMGITDYVKDLKKDAIAFSIGGDNYCYGDYINSLLCRYNEILHENGIKTALIGCSIDPEVLKNDKVLYDLNMYDLILARETLTYNALLEAGINRNTVLMPDSAFRLNTIKLPLPDNFIEGETIGINMSQLVISANEKDNVVFNNYVKLIKYIIENTNYNIALIPHVFWNGSNDYETMKDMYNLFSYTNRICLIEKHSAEELKGYIARCKIFIGARTHATIAAYSSCVPTLAIGYSVKAKGIAIDLFGEYEKYIVEAQKFKNEDELLNAFLYIEKNCTKIKQHLQQKIPEYIKRLDQFKGYIDKLKEKQFIAPLPKDECTGCTACLNACPVQCIDVIKDDEGFERVAIDYKKCIKCGKCQIVCPVNQKDKKIKKPEVYAVKNKDEIREKSSSGGVFYSLAKKIIDENGIVYGAAFNENLELKHIRVKNITDLQKIQGSKYVASSIGNSYKSVKSDLENGLKVLFSGTPCQIKGLKGFLQKEYDNLYTVDVVCHGTPSEKVFKEYISSLEEQNGSKVIDYSFRNKDNGWKKFNTKITFENGKTIVEPFDKNIYMLGFLRNLYLRKSCYSCTSNKLSSGSDITLADFWGINEIEPEFDDDKGVSLVIINSEKGKKIFSDLNANFEYKVADIFKAIQYNKSIINVAFKNNNREKFFAEFGDKPIEKNIEDNLYD